jgi:hypothetical protein
MDHPVPWLHVASYVICCLLDGEEGLPHHPTILAQQDLAILVLLDDPPRHEYPLV